MVVTYDQIRTNKEIRTYIAAGDDSLGVLGFTEHSFRHAEHSARVAADILQKLGCSDRQAELARIAGLMHDIGNAVNRQDHVHTGAVMAFRILGKLGMEPEEIAEIIAAIGNHDENTGRTVNSTAAALILADKSDVRRSRVRRGADNIGKDIHDRVNYAVVHSGLTVHPEEKVILLELEIDTVVCPVMEYFEIFLVRMMMCRRAADFLGMKFKLHINHSEVL